METWHRCGHPVAIWTLNGEPPEGTPAWVTPRKLRWQMPYPYIGRNHPHIPGGGRGSVSQWADQTAYRLLHEEGGIFSQLDVACLRSFMPPPEVECVTSLRGTNLAAPVVAHFPKGSSLALTMATAIETCIDRSEWHWAIRAASIAAQSAPVLMHEDIMVDCGGLCRETNYDRHTQLDKSVQFIHWSNATHHRSKNDPKPGSTYDMLLRHVGLTPA